MKRLKLLLLLARLDEESFTWIVLALRPSAMTRGGNCQIWPDGLGGFRDRDTLEAIRAAADELVTAVENGESI